MPRSLGADYLDRRNPEVVARRLAWKLNEKQFQSALNSWARVV